MVAGQVDGLVCDHDRGLPAGLAIGVGSDCLIGDGWLADALGSSASVSAVSILPADPGIGDESDEDSGETEAPVDPAGLPIACTPVPGGWLCPNLGRRQIVAEPGPWSLSIELADGATRVIDDAIPPGRPLVVDPPMALSIPLVEAVLSDQRSLRFTASGTDADASLDLVVRPRNGTEVVARVPLGTVLEGGALQVDLDLDLPIGRYRFWPCVARAGAAVCQELSGGYEVQVIDPVLVPLVPDHNIAEAQRINVVFAGSGIGGDDEFGESILASVARQLLGLDGPVLHDGELHYGPMAIEPLRSNADRFNFWYLDTDLGDEQSLLGAGNDPSYPAGFEPLENVAITVLYASDDGPSDARVSSLWTQTVPPSADEIGFGGVRVAVDLDDPLDAAATVAHEWGHGLFELRDEYVGFDGRDVLTQFPNCAPTEADAEAWWGELVGATDPFALEVLEQRAAAGLEPEPRAGESLVELTTVTIVPGGCYGEADATTAWRPTVDSLMNSELPVFGAVNRRWVEQVLSRFSGAVPTEPAADQPDPSREPGPVDPTYPADENEQVDDAAVEVTVEAPDGGATRRSWIADPVLVGPALGIGLGVGIGAVVRRRRSGPT